MNIRYVHAMPVDIRGKSMTLFTIGEDSPSNSNLLYTVKNMQMSVRDNRSCSVFSDRDKLRPGIISL